MKRYDLQGDYKSLFTLNIVGKVGICRLSCICASKEPQLKDGAHEHPVIVQHAWQVNAFMHHMIRSGHHSATLCVYSSPCEQYL